MSEEIVKYEMIQENIEEEIGIGREKIIMQEKVRKVKDMIEVYKMMEKS